MGSAQLFVVEHSHGEKPDKLYFSKENFF